MFDNPGFKVLKVCSGVLTLLMSSDLEMIIMSYTQSQVAPIVCVCVGGGGVLCLVPVLLFDDLCPSSFAIILMRESWLLFFLMSCDSQCSLALPLGAAHRWLICGV